VINWAGEKPANLPPVRLATGPVLAGCARDLSRHARWVPGLAWPTVLAASAAALIQSYALTAPLGRLAVAAAVVPFAVMLVVAWQRLLLLGPDRVTAPPVRWTRRHTRVLALLVGVVAAHAAVLAFVLVAVAALPMRPPVRAWILLASVWFVVTLFTPLSLKLPGAAAGLTPPPRAWQARPAHFGNAALVWLAVFLVSGPLAAGAGLLIASAGAPVAVHVPGAIVGAGVICLALLVGATAKTRMLRALSTPAPGEDP